MKLKFFQRGVSLYITLVILSLILAILLGLNVILIQQIKSIGNIGYSVIAFYAADTGMEQTIKKINSSDYRDFPIYEPLQPLSNGANYKIEAICCKKDAYRCVFQTNGEKCPILNGGNPIEQFSDGSECASSSGEYIRFCIRSVGTYKEIKRAIEVKL